MLVNYLHSKEGLVYIARGFVAEMQRNRDTYLDSYLVVDKLFSIATMKFRLSDLNFHNLRVKIQKHWTLRKRQPYTKNTK